ncbi:hypothetical protein [Chondromyces apiculatus]|uniref:Uncharacterized protein n=1 Tax=Chondromyces apiculatus DSM 436 TaxID=1192034 RepID=A0A017TCX9_9BACT|nr:hypothetical protein [Chondromyces apiculatus]EYF07064.1 Hypothetical protein CAP_1323 [Chondromyces apiculatus DSM 436]
MATAGARVGEAIRGDAKRLLAQRGKDAAATFGVAAARESAAGAKVAAKLGIELDVLLAGLAGAALFVARGKRVRGAAEHLCVGSLHAVAARMGTALPAKIEAATAAVAPQRLAGADGGADVEEPGEAG